MEPDSVFCAFPSGKGRVERLSGRMKGIFSRGAIPSGIKKIDATSKVIMLFHISIKIIIFSIWSKRLYSYDPEGTLRSSHTDIGVVWALKLLRMQTKVISGFPKPFMPGNDPNPGF